MPKLPSRRWWMRLAFGAVWTPIAAEIFLRFLAPVPMLPRYIEAGPHGVRANMPSRTYRHQTPEYTVKIQTNSQGMRAETDFEKSKPEGVRRIAILGDSFGMGYGVDLEDSSLHLLGEMLEDKLNCPIEILNFSVSGFGPAEELVVLESEVLQYAPDLVIQYFCSNDPTDDLRAGLFTLKDGELIRSGQEYLPAVKIREFLFSFPTYRWLAGESHFYNLARDRAGGTAKSVLASIRAAARSSKAPMKEPSPRPTDTELSAAQQLTVKILEEMKNQVTSHDAEFLILSIPSRKKRDVFVDTFPYADGQDLKIVDPLDSFMSADGKMLYWENSHGHWTPLGCRLVAENLAARILTDHLLDPCDS